MTSCWERVSLINSPSPPQGTSHGSTRPFGLRSSKIFEGSVSISLEEETTTLDEDLSFWRLEELIESMELLLDPITSFHDDEDSLTLDEDATLEELQMSLRLELSGVGVELDELEAILKELDDRATLDEELFFWELEDSIPGPE